MVMLACRSCGGLFSGDDLHKGQCVGCVKKETGLVLRSRGARWQEIPSTITVFYTPRSTRRRFVVLYGEENWPIRSLQAKGLEKAEVVYRRPATVVEQQQQVDSFRYLAFGAKVWADVVESEAELGIDASALASAFLERHQLVAGDSPRTARRSRVRGSGERRL